jgi:hypothetical protein
MASVPPTTSPKPPPKNRKWMVVAAVAVLVAAGLAAFLLARDGADSAAPTPLTPTTPNTTAPFAASADGLATLARVVPDPIYWAGPRDVQLYEVTHAANGSVTVRYLPEGAEPGDKRRLLAVGTYPFKDAVATAERLMKQPETVTVPVDGSDALAFHGATAENNVYMVFPGKDIQVEVYSPVSGEAAQIVGDGEIVRVR